jgi:hypothetical protein
MTVIRNYWIFLLEEGGRTDGPSGLRRKTALDDALPRGIIARDHNLLPLGDTFAIPQCTRWLRSLLSLACLLCTLVCDVVRIGG